MIQNKKAMSAWTWILIIVILLLMIGVVAYLLLVGGDGGSLIGSGSSIPKPPALPE